MFKASLFYLYRRYHWTHNKQKSIPSNNIFKNQAMHSCPLVDSFAINKKYELDYSGQTDRRGYGENSPYIRLLYQVAMTPTPGQHLPHLPLPDWAEGHRRHHQLPDSQSPPPQLQLPPFIQQDWTKQHLYTDKENKVWLSFTMSRTLGFKLRISDQFLGKWINQRGGNSYWQNVAILRFKLYIFHSQRCTSPFWKTPTFTFTVSRAVKTTKGLVVFHHHGMRYGWSRTGGGDAEASTCCGMLRDKLEESPPPPKKNKKLDWLWTRATRDVWVSLRFSVLTVSLPFCCEWHISCCACDETDATPQRLSALSLLNPTTSEPQR